MTTELAPADHRELGLDDTELVDMYRTMVLARRLDERMWALNRQGLAPFVLSVSGHEATQVGAAFAMNRSDDWALPYYRDLAVNLALGVTAEEVMLGVFSKATDPASGGRQMPNHWSDPSRRILTHSSVIATQYPHACGIAYRLKQQQSNAIVMVFGGEGSTSEGDWHEAMNFAGIHQLPMVFVIENNQYAISVPEAQEVAGNLADRGLGYGIPGMGVDGNDMVQVYAAAKTAVDRARDGEGPSLLVARTYRFYAHTSDDDDTLYRTAEEVEIWRRKDPLTIAWQYLTEQRLLDEKTEEEIDEWAADTVAAAVSAAEAAPDATDATGGVYANPIVPSEPVTEVEEVPEGEEVNLITAVNRALHDVMTTHADTVLFGEDVAHEKGGVFKATEGLSKAFGNDRLFNTPLSESLIVGLAIGMGAAGAKPLAEIQFADFIHPAFDQLVSEAARIHYRSNGGWNCPITVRTPYGGGIHGSLYHSQSIEAFYSHVPGLKVVVPSTPADVKGLLMSAVEDPDPVLFLEPKKLYRLAKGPYPEGPHRVPLGRAALRRKGEDLYIIAYGTMAHFAMEAASELESQGVDAGVLDLRTLKPLDWPSVQAAVEATGKIIIVHEDNEFGGYGAEIAAQIGEKAFDWLDAPVQRYATPDVPTFPFAESLEAQVMPSVAGIVERAAQLAAH
ncbi:MAG: dehydrogenase E1 component subunit alpha/beta [Acidimicrobiia bacterium]|nr:dehydrogenase E1 component subunit alpha/beta [Acidimicrobiia bacterium]